jgi:ribose 1,5-bisphosphokinase
MTMTMTAEPPTSQHGPASSAPTRSPAGRLVLVVGPSGAGKDSVLDWVRTRIDATSDAANVRFARRTITRPADAGGERHIAVDCAGFERLRAAGAFALCWSANGHAYGIGHEIRSWLEAGLTVVVSASRAHLPDALHSFPQARVVLVTASAPVLRSRLLSRARESREEIEARIVRASAFTLPPDIEALEIVNDGALEAAGGRLLALLET